MRCWDNFGFEIFRIAVIWYTIAVCTASSIVVCEVGIHKFDLGRAVPASADFFQVTNSHQNFEASLVGRHCFTLGSRNYQLPGYESRDLFHISIFEEFL